MLQKACTFFHESSRRLHGWKQWTQKHCTSSNKLKRLVKLGKTRWWSPLKAVTRICDEPKSYYILLGLLWELRTAPESTTGTKTKSADLLTNWLTFQSLLTAISLRELLITCDHVTKYMHTPGLDQQEATLFR